jgi:hypothetical protein
LAAIVRESRLARIESLRCHGLRSAGQFRWLRCLRHAAPS